ncbi:MAG TPA: protease inhibitor I42 family protein [Polyangiaceae bacterium]|nr:protease inhibitor I42 family protein [Polyangiaceae bacterium]
MITLDASFNRRVVRACVGDLLRLDLPEDPFAGNRWVLPDPLPSQLRLVSDKTRCERDAIYAAGDRRLEFRIVGDGSFALSLVSSRGWQQTPTQFEVLVETGAEQSEALPESSRRGSSTEKAGASASYDTEIRTARRRGLL